MNPKWLKMSALYRMGIENRVMKLQAEWQNGEVQSPTQRNVVNDSGQVQAASAETNVGQQRDDNPVNGTGY